MDERKYQVRPGRKGGDPGEAMHYWITLTYTLSPHLSPFTFHLSHLLLGVSSGAVFSCSFPVLISGYFLFASGQPRLIQWVKGLKPGYALYMYSLYGNYSTVTRL
jgi:hypothetical protein